MPVYDVPGKGFNRLQNNKALKLRETSSLSLIGFNRLQNNKALKLRIGYVVG